MPLYLYHVVGTLKGYDTFSDFVVAAQDEATARATHPNGPEAWTHADFTWDMRPESVRVRLLGVVTDATIQAGIICASFHAG